MTSAGSYYGFTPEIWQALVREGLRYLEGRATHSRPCTYTEFCNELRTKVGVAPDPHDHATAALLGEIGTETYTSRGVIVTALVMYKNGGFEPGPGFYKLAQELGVLETGTLTEDQKLAFVSTHTRAVLAAYPRRPRSR